MIASRRHLPLIRQPSSSYESTYANREEGWAKENFSALAPKSISRKVQGSLADDDNAVYLKRSICEQDGAGRRMTAERVLAIHIMDYDKELAMGSTLLEFTMNFRVSFGLIQLNFRSSLSESISRVSPPT